MKNYLILCLLAATLGSYAADMRDNFHQDHRGSFAKLSFVKGDNAPAGLSGRDHALSFLEANHQRYGLDSTLANLKLSEVRESLLGTHYTFQQMQGSYRVSGGNIVVSISSENGGIYRIYNNTYPVNNNKRIIGDANLDSEDALDIAWFDLRVHGDLLLAPTVEAVFLPEGDGFRLVYRTEVSTDAPFGYWGHTIDAKTGMIINAESLAISRVTVEHNFKDYNGPILDRAKTTARFQAEQAQRLTRQAGKLMALSSGTGVVFDPDAVTTLADDTLEDGSAASSFTAAYFTRTLQDIDLTGGTYSLTGPWVEVASFENPNTPPTTTTTGNWTGTRGNQEFNDAMTYFHVDQNQRYMQSLGFTGVTGIQYGSIEADADGLNGADNSHYIPSSNRMAFGLGCVDDNEDAFVILHEYGHAIHFSINSNWSGGDTGGMGEGFGDYWGGAYRYSTPNGPSFHPEWAFPWDGHNNCWGGRLLNNTTGQYNPSSSYPAHSSVGGVLSDELWSAPLFQSLVRLTTEFGVAQGEVDQIILEAHFGISSGPTMRDMAAAIVATAEALQPAGPHAGVLREEFEARNILEVLPSGSQTDVINDTLPGEVTHSHPITVSDGVVTLTLDWTGGNVNLNLELYGPSGSLVASAASGSNPEVISYDTGGTSGSYRIDVINTAKKKSATYVLTANYNP